MAITKTTQPYECLIRWNADNGKFQAYHFKTLTKVMEDGNVLAATENTMNVSQATSAGFALDAIMDQAMIDALEMIDDLNATVKEKDALIAEHIAALADAQRELSKEVP